MEIKAVIDGLFAIGLGHAPEHRHILARTRRGAEFEHHLLRPLGRLDPVDLVELFHPALHLRRVACPRLEPFDELDFLGQHRLLALELGLLVLVGDGPLGLIEFVIARIGGQRAAIDLDDLVDHPVHERPVVRGHEQSAGKNFQKVLEPDQAFKIEMVGRLIEQQHVRPRQQDLGQRHAHLPAARQRPHIAIHHGLGKPQPVEHFARPSIERIPVELFELFGHLAIARDDRIHLVGLVGVAHIGFELAHLGAERRHRPGAVHGFGYDRAPGHLAHVLGEIPDARAPIDGNLPLVGRLLAGDHAKQRRLA